MLAGSDVVKVSDDDLKWLSPGTPAEDAARALLDAGPAVVLLTRGAEGAVAVTRDGSAEVAAPAVEVVDTIGAGDAFSGGWLGYWSEQDLGRADLARSDEVVAATRFAASSRRSRLAGGGVAAAARRGRSQGRTAALRRARTAAAATIVV